MTNGTLSRLVFLFLLSISLTAASAMGQSAPGPDRRAYVKAAYEDFYTLIYFLSGSDRFLNQLTPDERAQFETLGNSIIQHGIRIGDLPTPGQDRTSRLAPHRLKFSNRREDFKLPGETTERTAKFDGDVWFNLNIINDPKTPFGLLDAFQIMFHEFGHLLPKEQKNQGAIDRVAAKMRTYLHGFYKDIPVGSGLSAKTLALPYLMADGAPVDLQVEPIVIFELDGRTAQAHLNVPQAISPGLGYSPARSDIQAFTRVSLTPQIKPYQGSVLVEWQVEAKHLLINAFRFNYIDLYVNSEKTEPVQPLPPVLEYKTLFQRLSAPELGRLLTTPQDAVPEVQLKNYAESPHPYAPAVDQKWHEKLKIAGQEGDRLRIEGVVESPEPLREVSLGAQRGHNVLQLPGVAERLTGDIYRVKFSVPLAAAGATSLHLQSLVLNSKSQWDLEEPVNVALNPATAGAQPQIRRIEVFDGKVWRAIDQISEPDLKTDEVRMRFFFASTAAKMNHLELTWLFQDAVLRGAQPAANRFHNVHEVIPASQLTQSRQGDLLIVEFTSQKASRHAASIQGKNGFTVRDSGLHALRSLQFVDEKFNVVATGTRLTNSGWRTIFTLNKPAPSTCEALFRP